MPIDLLADDQTSGPVDLLADDVSQPKTSSSQSMGYQPFPGAYPARTPTRADLKEAAHGSAEALSYMIPGLDVVKGAGLIPKAANFLSRTASGTMATAIPDLIDPNNKDSINKTWSKNALLNTAAQSLPIVGKGIKAVIDYAQPQKYAQQILDKLGNGRNIADNARIFAGKIKNAYEKAKLEGQKLYDDVFNHIHSVHPSVFGGSLVAEDSAYRKLPKEFTAYKHDPDLRDLHQKYINHSNLETAHNFQSQLGYEIRSLEKMNRNGNLDPAGKSVLKGYLRSQKALQTDMDTAFDEIAPDLKNKYVQAKDYWSNHVIPYEQNSKISTIVKSDPKKLKNKQLHNISHEFKNPDEDIQTILDHVGPSASNHILYDKLGKLSGNVTPQKLLKGITDLKNSGFGEHITSELESMLKGLGHRENFKTGVQALPGAASALAIGSKYGTPALAAASVLGTPASILLSRYVNKLIHPETLVKHIENALTKSYPSGSRAGINALNKSQGSN